MGHSDQHCTFSNPLTVIQDMLFGGSAAEDGKASDAAPAVLHGGGDATQPKQESLPKTRLAEGDGSGQPRSAMGMKGSDKQVSDPPSETTSAPNSGDSSYSNADHQPKWSAYCADSLQVSVDE